MQVSVIKQICIFEDAVEKFSKAKKWNPKLDINPESKAKAIILTEEGRSSECSLFQGLAHSWPDFSRYLENLCGETSLL